MSQSPEGDLVCRIMHMAKKTPTKPDDLRIAFIRGTMEMIEYYCAAYGLDPIQYKRCYITSIQEDGHTA